MGWPTGIEPVLPVPQTGVITISLWPPWGYPCAEEHIMGGRKKQDVGVKKNDPPEPRNARPRQVGNVSRASSPHRLPDRWPGQLELRRARCSVAANHGKLFRRSSHVCGALC